MSGVAAAVVLGVFVVVFVPTFLVGRRAPEVRSSFPAGLGMLVAGTVVGDGGRIWLDQTVLSLVFNRDRDPRPRARLLLDDDDVGRGAERVLADRRLSHAHRPAAGAGGAGPTDPLGTSLDIIQVSLALFVFHAVSRTLTVTLPTAGPARLVAQTVLMVRVLAWSCIAAHGMGLLPNGMTAAKVFHLLLIPTALAQLLNYRNASNRTRYYKSIETSPVLPYVLATIVVAMVATVLTFYQDAERLPVLVLAAGCAIALLVRQVVGNHRLSTMILHSREQEHYFRTLVQDSTDVIMICDDAGRLRYVSPAVENLLPAEAGVPKEGDRVNEVLGVAEDRLLASLASVRAGDQLLVEGRRGEQVLEASLTPRGDEFVLSVRDVSERDRLRERLHDMAFHDALTGLANRHRLLEEVGELLVLQATARGRGSGSVTALFIDLDRFKSINDASGHHVGDAFTVEDVAQRIHEALVEPFTADERVYQIGASIGIAQAQPGVSAEELIQRADLAMYEAKQARRPWRVYEPAMWATVQSQPEADQLIARSWGPQSAVMFVQPVVFTRTFAVHSTEALLRWRVADGVVGSPSAVLGFAQRTGRLAALTDWMLAMAVDELAERRLVDVPIAVNMPPQLLTNPATIDQLAVRCGVGRCPRRGCTWRSPRRRWSSRAPAAWTPCTGCASRDSSCTSTTSARATPRSAT
nr:diguanylate cyclase [Arsenicicoccus piscis]